MMKNKRVRSFFFLFIVVLTVLFNGCHELQEKEKEVSLDLLEGNKVLIVELENMSGRTLRLWDVYNSWGWFGFQVLVSEKKGDKLYYVTRSTTREWSMNIPTTHEVEPKSSCQFTLDLTDGWWDIPRELMDLRGSELVVQVKYKIDATEESKEFHVLTGMFLSQERTLKPPHNWLPESERLPQPGMSMAHKMQLR